MIALGFATTLMGANFASAQTVDGTLGPPPAPSALHAPDRAAPGAAERMAPPHPLATLHHQGNAADPGIAGYVRRPMAGTVGD